VKDIALGKRIFYSRMLKCKIIIQIFMGVLSFLIILLGLTLPSDLQAAPWIAKEGHRPYALAYLCSTVAWFLSARLLIFEYRRRLNEAFYTHQLFWILNFVIELIILILLFQKYVRCLGLNPQAIIMKTISVCHLLLNLSLCVLMVLTKKRREAAE